MTHHLNYLKTLCCIVLLSNLLPIYTSAQPANDECTNAITVVDLDNFCSIDGAYTNENAVTTTWSSGGTLSNNGKDVWFRFTAQASHVTIIARGRGQGGTIRSPEVELLADNQCGTDFIVLESVPGNFSDIAELNQGGLIPGATYLFRVQGENGREGSFQLCINNYFPPQAPGSDIEVASMLCDKSPFVVQQIIGAGENNNEAEGTCLDVGGIFGIPSEQSSTWFTWIAANDGTLEFTLDPINPEDDLDFVLYELPNGVNDGNGKIALRCMATACLGPTGLNATSTDLQEDADCDPGEDGFVKAVEMQAGKAYGLLINNFTESGNGFSLDFGGTVDFQSPDPALTTSVDGEIVESATLCLGETVSFDASASRFPQGNIVSYEWVFGVGANPATATGVNSGAITYEEPGVKTVVLTITTDRGCKVTEVREAIISVDTCCLAVDILTDVTQIELGESTTLETEVRNAIGDVQYEWSPAEILSCSDCPNPSITPTENTTVSVIITDENGCEAMDTIAIEVEIIIKEISIPNAFTPDFDGTNDRFTLLGGNADDRILSFQIYTRWGDLVFETANIPLGDSDRGWDGMYKGKRMQPDVFIYHAVVALADGMEKTYTGDVTLIR